jgi:uncharacterized protein (DUF2141 family)
MMFGVAVSAFAVSLCMSTIANAGSVDVIVSGTQPAGKVFGEVFADASSFKSRNKPSARFALDPQGGTTVRTTLALPPGRYAVALFQDTKGTGKLESNFFGVPTVPYGFSNNARGTMGPPGFDAAAFDVGAAATTVSIELR